MAGFSDTALLRVGRNGRAFGMPAILAAAERDDGMAKVVCVLYDDPIDGSPTSYARYDLPNIEEYPDGQTLPNPKAIDFTPGTLIGSVSGALAIGRQTSRERVSKYVWASVGAVFL